MQTTNPTTITKKALIIFILGACFYFYDFIIQVSPGVMADRLMGTFNITAASLGTAMGVYFYSYTAMQIPAGLMLDQFGAKKVLSSVIAICAIGALVFAAATNIYMAGIGRFIMGGASAFAFLSTLYLILRWIPGKYFALFVGLTQMLGSFGAAWGEAPLAYFIRIAGWRHAMITFAIFGFVLAALVYFIVVEHVSVKKTSSKNLKDALQRLKQALKNKQTLPVALYSFCIWSPVTIFAALWGVPYLRDIYHLTDIQAGTGIMIIWVSMAFACPAAGWLSDYIKRRNIVLLGLAITGLIGVLVLVYSPHLPGITLYICLALIGIASAGQSLIFAVIKDNQPVHLTGVANGFNNMCIVFSGAIFQPLVGKILDHYWTGEKFHNAPLYHSNAFHHAFIILPAVYIVASLTIIFLVKETYCKHLGKKTYRTGAKHVR